MLDKYFEVVMEKILPLVVRDPTQHMLLHITSAFPLLELRDWPT
jgi:hypothetical protein